MKILIDTNIIIDVLRKNFDINAKRLLNLIEKQQFKGYISVITVAELFQGAYSHDQSIVKLNNLLAIFTILDINTEIAKLTGKINGQLMKQGKKLNIVDVLISASSIKNGINMVITNNKKHFENIDQIQVFSPQDFLKKENWE